MMTELQLLSVRIFCKMCNDLDENNVSLLQLAKGSSILY